MAEVLDRVDQLLAGLVSAIRLRDAWMASGLPRITNEFAEAVDDVMEQWKEGDIPADCRILYEPYLKLQSAWNDFGDYMSEREPAPRKPFWDALKHLEELLIAREDRFIPPALETVTELAEMKPNPCTWRAIAYIYSHKGEGPFMRNKEPVTSLVIQQYKWEQQVAGGKNADGTYVKAVPGARDVVTEYFKARGIDPLDENGNMVSMASLEIMNRSNRLNNRLKERVARILSGNGAVTHADEMIDDAPRTRAELDALEGNVPAVAPGAGVPDPSSDPDSMQGMVDASEEARLAADIYRLHDMNPNVDNRSIADTLGISVNQVKKALQKRSKV